MKFLEFIKKIGAWIKNFFEDGNSDSSSKRLVSIAAFTVAIAISFKDMGVDYTIAFLTYSGALLGISAFTKT